MIDKVKKTTFDHVDRETWEAIASKSLRGIPLESLVTETAENIQIKPLYTREDLESFSEAEQNNLHQTIRNSQYNETWTIAQLQYAKTGEEYVNLIINSLHNGNEAIIYNGKNQLRWDEEQLKKLATLSVDFPVFAMDINKDDQFLTLFDFIPKELRPEVTGAISGKTVSLPVGYDNIRTVCADSRDIHHDGADSVTELALVLAQAAEQSITFADFSTFSKQFFVYFSIDTHFFMEIAKLRAFRQLWRTFSQAYGENNDQPIPVFSENSLRSYSKLDPQVNMLRAGNEALSAVLGGTDVLTIHPYNVLTNVTETSRRIARNVQLVIKHETFVSHIIDPAAGSYYLDQLTKEIIENAWDLFLKIESAGGYKAYMESGALDKHLHTLRKYRVDHLKHSEQSLIGTNIYADLTAEIEPTKNKLHVNNRLAEPYEQFRTYFKDKQPEIAILTFGDLANFKPRADFVSSYLAAGGLTCTLSPAFLNITEAYKWLEENKFDFAVICASVKETEAIVEEFIKDLPKKLPIDVAGNYHDNVKKKWLEAGINGFIYKGQDQLGKLNEIKAIWKGGRNE